MKRRRETETETESSEIMAAIDELSVAAINHKTTAADNQATPCVPIKPFLSLCGLLVRVLDKIGPKMAVLRQDIHHNIQRLEKLHDSNPSLYWDMVEILRKEVNEGKAKKGPTTCSKAVVWLTRSLELALCLLQLLVKDLDMNMEQAVQESYNLTLKPWHGWISSTAYKVALKLVPDSRSFIYILKAGGEDDDDVLKQQLQSLISLLLPLLEQNKSILRQYGLDKLKSI